MKKSPKNKKRLQAVRTVCLLFVCLCVLFVSVCNAIVIGTALPHRETMDELQSNDKPYDCVIVLGAGIKDDGTLSNLLRDRMTMGLALLESGCADTLLLTGDSQFAKEYDEVGAMAAYAIDHGAAEAQILQDPLGLSTYDSLWRAKYVYGMDRVLIVTQNFHLDRALYLADALELDCAGIVCDVTMALPANHIREAAARLKALYYGITLPDLTEQKG